MTRLSGCPIGIMWKSCSKTLAWTSQCVPSLRVSGVFKKILIYLFHLFLFQSQIRSEMTLCGWKDVPIQLLTSAQILFQYGQIHPNALLFYMGNKHESLYFTPFSGWVGWWWGRGGGEQTDKNQSRPDQPCHTWTSETDRPSLYSADQFLFYNTAPSLLVQKINHYRSVQRKERKNKRERIFCLA